jgi:Uma2 family endonuclease
VRNNAIEFEVFMTEEELSELISKSYKKGQIDGFDTAFDLIIEIVIEYKETMKKITLKMN